MCLTCPQKVSMLVQRQESISCRPLWMAESKNAENGIFINTYFNETEAHPLDHCNTFPCNIKHKMKILNISWSTGPILTDFMLKEILGY